MSALRLTPGELVQAFEAGQRIQVLDVRASGKVATSRIDVPHPHIFLNIPGSEVRSLASLEGSDIDPSIPIVTVCGHGNDSYVVAAHLHSLGANARSLDGGMAAWSQLTLPRVVRPHDGLDALLQFDRPGKASLSYVLISDGQAFIIDPPRDVTPHFTAIRDAGADLVGVADTHVHADYISGGPRLAQAYGLPYYLHPADAVFPYDGTPGTVTFSTIADGDTIRLGRAEIVVMQTPGHTEGSVTYRIGKSMAFTGDFIFVASIGRPDLAGRTREWAARLWKSLRRARKELPEHCTILPAHYADHAERNSDGTVSRPFGSLLASQEVFRMEDERAFVEWVAAREAQFPEVYRTIKSVNVGLTTVTDEEAEVLEAGKNECALG